MGVLVKKKNAAKLGRFIAREGAALEDGGSGEQEDAAKPQRRGKG
jgi:hypothetical protein